MAVAFGQCLQHRQEAFTAVAVFFGQHFHEGLQFVHGVRRSLVRGSHHRRPVRFRRGHSAAGRAPTEGFTGGFSLTAGKRKKISAK
jgi:hypothetical protein